MRRQTSVNSIFCLRFQNMKIATIVVIALVVVIAVIALRAQSSERAASEAGKGKAASDPKETYAGLRQLMLLGSRSKFGLAQTSKPTEPWGVLMDWGMQGGTATVVTMSDGSASVYFSTGGGYIGGKGQEPIRIAAQKAVENAKLAQLPAQPTTAFALPEKHGVYFYLLTDAGVFLFRTSEQELNSLQHPLRKLGDSMQEVITQYRLWDQRRKEESQKRN